MSIEIDIDIDTQARNLNAAIAATEIRFNIEPSEILERFKGNERTIEFDEHGQPHAVYDREVLPLKDALIRWAADTEDVCDRRTLPRAPGGGRRGIASKADLQDAKSKAAYIAEHGYNAFAALPTKAQPTEELRFKDQFYKLPLSEKSRLIREHGENFVRSLPSRPTDQPFGGFIAHEKIAKIKAIRGRSAR